MNKHKIGAVIAAAMLVLTFAGTAFAGSLDWNGKNGWPVANGCNQDDTPPGSMLWIYTGDSDSAVKLTVNGVEYTGAQQGQGNGSWHIITPYFDTKPSASIVFTGEHDAGTLTISHGCPGEVTTTSESTTTSDETTTTEETTTTTEVTTTSEETTTTSTTTAPTGTLFAFPAFSIECGGFLTVTNFASANVDDALVTGPGDDLVITEDGTYPLVPGDYIGVGRIGGVAQTDEVPFTIEACPTSTTTSAEETTPGGSVEELTPPSTDTIGAPTSGSTVSTSLLLVLAGALASALVVIPAAARKRR
jgi:hypothetical protein